MSIKINILTLFPAVFKGFITESIPSIAIEKGMLSVNLIDIRDFTTDKHRQVDDYPYGGASGMVLKPEPLSAAIGSCPTDIPIIYFTPQGNLLTQKMVRDFATHAELTIICGHYKEIDQRIRDRYVTHEISIGDYILSGGELPAMALTDAIARLLEGVISDPDSALTDSHENGLLGFPCYTRPYDFQGMTVPDVLCNGHHLKIVQWREQQSLALTKKIRPELLLRFYSDREVVTSSPTPIYIGLVHHPVYNKAGETITSGITNLDVHDISRTCLTYGVKSFYLIHPNQRQREIFENILSFWKTELATLFNRHRVDALRVINFKKNIDDTIKSIKNQEGSEPIIITTTANDRNEQSCFTKIRHLVRRTTRPVLLLFGTGNGLHESIHELAHFILVPIQAKTSYNHLSVRSAVAIVMDRLLSEEYKEE